MAKKKTDDEAFPEAEPTATATPAGKKMSKMDGVRAALKAGVDKPIDGVNYLKSQYGLDITAQMFSSYKSKAQAEGGEAAKSGSVKVAAAAKSATVQIPAASNNGTANAPDPAKLAKSLKDLVATYGSTAVINMSKVFAE